MMRGHFDVGVGNKTLAYVGRNVDFTRSIGYDIRLEEFLP